MLTNNRVKLVVGCALAVKTRCKSDVDVADKIRVYFAPNVSVVELGKLDIWPDAELFVHVASAHDAAETIDELGLPEQVILAVAHAVLLKTFAIALF